MIRHKQDYDKLRFGAWLVKFSSSKVTEGKLYSCLVLLKSPIVWFRPITAEWLKNQLKKMWILGRCYKPPYLDQVLNQT